MMPRDEILYKIERLIYAIQDTEDAIINMEIKLKMLNNELLKLKEMEDEEVNPGII